MSNVRKKLMEEIEKGAKKRKESNSASLFSKSVEGIVFDFFKNFDELSGAGFIDGGFDHLYREAYKSMVGQLRAIDGACQVSVGYVSNSEDSEYVADNKPQSVTISWSSTHQLKNGGVESTSVDISQMLFF